jgi:hypothetical protein
MLMWNPAQLRRTSFIALVAMLVLVLAPTVNRTVVAAEPAGSTPIEVCTTEGMKWVSLASTGLDTSGDHQKDPNSVHEHGGDCPYCSLQTVKFLTTAASGFATSEVANLLPTLFYQATKPLFAWAHARSRAPPLSA